MNVECGLQSLRWSSSNSRVASVDANGKITAKKVGSATISACTTDGKTAECIVNVKYMAMGLKLNKTSLVLGEGETFDIDSTVMPCTAANCRYYSSVITNVASVMQYGGLVTANTEGETTIACTTYNGLVTFCNVTVKKPPEYVKLDCEQKIMQCGQSEKLYPKVDSNSASQCFAYDSSNNEVASVDGNGIITAKAFGSAVITCTAYNGKYAQCVIYVN